MPPVRVCHGSLHVAETSFQLTLAKGNRMIRHCIIFIGWIYSSVRLLAIALIQLFSTGGARDDSRGGGRKY